MKWLDLFVGGQRWGVYLVGEKSKRLLSEDGSRCNGQAFLEQCRIYINRDQSAPARDEVLLHELLHAVLQVSGASHTINSSKKEEDIVRDVTPLLHRLLTDLGFRFPRGFYT